MSGGGRLRGRPGRHLRPGRARRGRAPLPQHPGTPEVQVTIAPVTVGGGRSCCPSDVTLRLSLTGTQQFGNRMARHRYDVRR